MHTNKAIRLMVLAVLLLGTAAGCAPATEGPPGPEEPAAPTSIPTEPDEEPAPPEEQAEVPDEIVVLFDGSDPGTLDPIYDTTATSTNIYDNLFDTLIHRANDGSVEPGIAESWENPSDTVWEFKIREGVQFHNGETLDATDVAFTLGLIIDPETESRWGPHLADLESVELVDETTVRVTTKQPYAPLLARMTAVWILPDEYYQEVGGEEFGVNPVGSGAYEFVEWVRDDHLTMVANEDYWRGAPSIGTAIWRLVADPLTRVAALRAGEADIIFHTPVSEVEGLNSDPNIRVESVPSARVMFAGFDTFEPPFDDVRVRQALNYAVDKEAIIENILGGWAFQTASVGGVASFGYDESIEPYPYDPEMALELLADAGYPNGFEADWHGTRGRYASDVEIQEAIAGYLEAVGVIVNLNLTDVGTFFDGWVNDQYTAFWFFGLGDPLLDLEYVINGTVYTGGRGWYYNSPETDELIAASKAEFDPEARAAIFSELLNILHEEAPWIFLWNEVSHWGVDAQLQWQPNADEDVWLFDASFE
jgi:peptide/nickel transport system substrate-binding protein